MYLNFKQKNGKTYQKSKGFPKASSNYNAKARSIRVKIHIKYHEYYVIYKNQNLKRQKKMNSKYNTTEYKQNKMNNYVHYISLFSLQGILSIPTHAFATIDAIIFYKSW
jgi:hypothetical protein